jgi:hypothetical protein
VSAIATRASKLCTAYRELADAAAAATAATAAKSDTVPAGADGLAERTEPVPEKQQLLAAHAELDRPVSTTVPLQTQECLELAYALCAKYSNGDANRAREVCLLATQLALSDRNKSSVVTVSHMEQTVRLT